MGKWETRWAFSSRTESASFPRLLFAANCALVARKSYIELAGVTNAQIVCLHSDKCSNALYTERGLPEGFACYRQVDVAGIRRNDAFSTSTKYGRSEFSVSPSHSIADCRFPDPKAFPRSFKRYSTGRAGISEGNDSAGPGGTLLGKGNGAHAIWTDSSEPNLRCAWLDCIDHPGGSSCNRSSADAERTSDGDSQRESCDREAD